MRLPDDYEDHGGGLTPTVISAIVADTDFEAPTEQYGCTDGECTTGRK